MQKDFDVSPIDNTSMGSFKIKRARASNFTSQEEDILMSLVEKHAKVLENKETNAVTWQEKNIAWEEISKEFGSQSNSIRSAKNLKDKYDNMKRKAKTALSLQRSETYKTGGGMSTSEMSRTDERIASLLGKAATGLPNDFDSDSYQNQIIEIDIEENEFDADQNSKPAEELDDKPNVWSKWNPSALKEQKSEKLDVKKCNQNDKNDHLLDKQTMFFVNEDRRAEERHNLQMNELRLKEELLKLEIIKKKLEIEKLQEK